MKSAVSIVRCGHYGPDAVYRALSLALELAGGVKDLKAYGRRVLLKPNILFGVSPDKAITTHPSVVEAAVRIFRENGFQVAAGDSPGLDTAGSASRKSGIAEVLEKWKVPEGDFTESVSVANPEGLMVRRFPVAKAWTQCDFVVTLPKLKTHTQMFFTGAMKNLFGVVPGLQKSQYHLRFTDRTEFADMIVDLNVLLKPRLAIMDAVTAMEGQGPSGGEPRHLGLLLASRDALALDAVACEMIGYRHRDIPIVRRAMDRKRHDWVGDWSEISIAGETLDSVKCPSFRKVRVTTDIGFFRKRVPEFVFQIAKDLWVPRPFFNHGKCIRCGRCVEICAPKALSFRTDRSVSGKRVSVDYSECIRCYCCHEICPVKAVDLRRLNRLV